MEKILITGARGQIGTELTTTLREIYGIDNVIATDVRSALDDFERIGPYEKLDVLDADSLISLIKKNDVGYVYHMAALLSATSEFKPKAAWKINMQGLLNVLDAAVETRISKVYWPSSIAVFGPTTPKQNTPQDTIMDPDTVYGISKLAGERWCDYYHIKHGLDVRSIRYPGIISHQSPPGGGTTDYAIDIFYEALQNNSFHCFIAEDTELPMMYMSDAIRATIELMESPSENINIRSSYNVSSISFAPKDIYEEIRKHLPHFIINYNPDFRQEIASGWPASIDDSKARTDWGWMPKYDLRSMTADMLKQIEAKLKNKSVTEI
ncbi:MAG: NAD-dependent epimerase/dehydratase family protein [Bacteroidetes bacterium]|nr:NAD-dependent epimerase/dehydratase family protein [Bacteroidota bacterium]